MPVPYEQLKAALLAEQAALTEEVEQLNDVIKEEGVGYSTHPADEGTTAFDQARDLAVHAVGSRSTPGACRSRTFAIRTPPSRCTNPTRSSRTSGSSSTCARPRARSSARTSATSR